MLQHSDGSKIRLLLKREHRLAKALAGRGMEYPVSAWIKVDAKVAERVIRMLKKKVSEALRA